MQTSLEAIESAINEALPTQAPTKQRRPLGSLEATPLFEALAYASLGGGKRVRGLLCLASGEALAADRKACMQAAVALELIHAYSLVHDDMPCMDNDVLRRGKPTVHVAYGEATAMLVGDGLQALAFEVLSGIHACGLPSQQCLEAVSALARASGPQGMVGGQAIDLAVVGATASSIDLQQLQSMHELKTGALLKASVQLGMCCRQRQRLDPNVEALLNQFAAHLGLAFQVIDDVLDESASTEALGKTAGKDKAQQKPTYVSLMGLTAAGDFAHDLHRQALDCLAQAARLDSSLHREGIDHLAGLADLIVLRQH
ncbi:MAG: polyprenyl synthetase family protein [Burkholderiaceae bacterium]|jgi:farnesyl diphosphate synthase